MIFFAPVAYLGAAYYNGEDGIQKIKDLFDKNEVTEEVVDRGRFGIGNKPTKSRSNDDDEDLLQKDLEIKMLKERIERLESLVKEQNDFIRSKK